ncbi:MAG TPA: c-type cytochrome [Candidatus Acidoferrales bacterium]|nr:c-type cytochrome [Candidatus Acidoferrales bacterium]
MKVIRPWYAAALILALGVLGLASPAAAQLTQAAPPPHAAHPRATPESIAAGKALFEGTCANCHGIDGSGANGPNIRSAAVNLGPEGLYARIRGGAIGSGMPAFTALEDAQVWVIVDYVGSLGHEGAVLATGDAQKGKEIYDANGCAKCHAIAGQGGNLGPELSKIGVLRGTVKLQAILADPGANLPLDTSLQERAAYPAYLVYRVTTKDGKAIEGMRVNEDSFTMQLRDANGRLHSVQKFEVQKIEPLPGKTFMPSYKGKLSDKQIDDLVAYLSGLGGAQ